MSPSTTTNHDSGAVGKHSLTVQKKKVQPKKKVDALHAMHSSTSRQSRIAATPIHTEDPDCA
jgi:hypothetical protein